MSKDGRSKTIWPKKDVEKNIKLMGNTLHLSTEDVNAINRMYCGIESPTFEISKLKNTFSTQIFVSVLGLCLAYECSYNYCRYKDA